MKWQIDAIYIIASNAVNNYYLHFYPVTSIIRAN